MQSITVIGRRWFDKVNGNTYNSAEIIIDGKFVGKVPFGYGYDEHYVTRAAEWLEGQGLIKLERYSNGGGEQLWQYCKEHEIAFATSVSDGLKRDL